MCPGVVQAPKLSPSWRSEGCSQPPRFTRWLPGRGCQGEAMGLSESCTRVIEESEKQLCKAKGGEEDGGDARIPDLQTFSLRDAQRERSTASPVNRNSDACQEETSLPAAPGERQPPQWDFLPAMAPKAPQAHGAARCSSLRLGAPQRGSRYVPRARLVLCEHPAARGTERRLQGQGNVSDWSPRGNSVSFPLSCPFSSPSFSSIHICTERMKWGECSFPVHPRQPRG